MGERAPPRPSSPVGRRRAVLTNIAFQYVAVGLAVAQGVFLVPVYLRSMSLPLYGAWLATGNVLAWIELADPGLSTVMQQRAAAAFGRGDIHGLARTIGTGLGVSLLTACLPLAAWPFATPIAGTLGLPPADNVLLAAAFRVALVSMAVAIASYGVAAVNVAVHSSAAAGMVFATSGVASIVLTIVLLRYDFGLLALPLAGAARSAILLLGNTMALWLWLRRMKVPRIRFDAKEARGIGRQSLYTLTTRLGSALAGKVDLFITAALITPASAASLALTGKAFELVRLATERIGVAIAPGLAHLAGERGPESTSGVINGTLRVTITAAAVALTGVVALNQPFVGLWVGSEAFGGQALTVALAAATGVAVLSTTLYQVAYSLGAFRPSAVSSVLESLVKLAALLVLLRSREVIAVPISAAIAGLIGSALLLPRAIRASGGPRVSSVRWLVPIAASICVGIALWLVLGLGAIARWQQFIVAAVGLLVAGVGVALVANRAWIGRVVLKRGEGAP